MSASVTELKPSASADRVKVILSTGAVNRYGQIVHQDGWKLDAFRKNPIVHFNHNSDWIVGRADVAVEKRGLVADITLAEPGTSEVVDYVRSLVRQGLLVASSPGFMPLKYEFRKDGTMEIFEQELLEASLVAVGANHQALKVLNSFDGYLVGEGAVVQADAEEVVDECPRRKYWRNQVDAMRVMYGQMCPRMG